MDIKEVVEFTMGFDEPIFLAEVREVIQFGTGWSEILEGRR